MNNSQSISRSLVFAACAALVTVVGCGGGGGGGGGGAPAPSTSSPASPTDNTGGNGATTGTPNPSPSPTPTPSPAPTAKSDHAHIGWIGADTFAAGKASFLANPDYFNSIHPKWGSVQADGSVKVLPMADDADIMATAKQHNVKVIPLIDADDVSYLRNVMSSQSAIAQHAQMLTSLVQQHGWDGVELDYEHLWSSSDRAPYTALMQAVATSLHAQGKLLTLALPAMDHDMTDAAYDYTQLQNIVDVMHLMAYDYHYMGGGHLGPLAPKGWVNDVVTRVQSLGHPEKYVLGLANYGISGSWYTSAKDAAARCGGSYSSQTDHMTTCPLGHPEAGLAPHCTTANGDVWFEDVASMSEKAQLAKAHGLGGVGYWTMGDEPAGFFDAMKAMF